MVEWKKLGEVCSFNRGRTITAKDAVDGNIPVIAGGQAPSYYHNEANRNGESITVAGSGAYAGFVSYWNQPIFVSDAFTVDPTNALTHKYLFHWLKKNQEKLFSMQKGAGVPHVHGKDIANFEIPILSLAEQTRIVEQLDLFIKSIENLKEQIVQRQKQYEYYRSQLLDIEGKEGVEMKTLGEICIKTSNMRWKNISDKETYKYIDLSSVNRGNHIIDEVIEINKNNAPSRAQQIVINGDIILGTTRPTLRRYCQIPEQYDNQICSTGFCVYRANTVVVLNRWLFHNIGNRRFWDYCELKQQGAGYPCLSNSDAFAYMIPVPSLSEQQRIVSILDTFEASIQYSEAQLKLREKQYEYYRNKLLTFE